MRHLACKMDRSTIFRARARAAARIMPGALIALASCSSGDEWRTERYRDETSRREIVVAKRQGKQDGIALTVAAKCAVPDHLSFEFFTPALFRLAAGGKAIAYRVGMDGVPMTGRQAAFGAQDTLTIDASLPAAGASPAMDLRTAARINVQLFTPNGTTSVEISPNAPGLKEVYSACGIDPSKSIALQAPGIDPTLHRPAAPILPQGNAKPITLKTLTGGWACSGDLGYFGLQIDDYAFQFGDDSPWGPISGQVSIGASQDGVDNSTAFPISFTGSPWDGTDTPWSYSPLAGGTLYYVATNTGQSEQCVKN